MFNGCNDATVRTREVPLVHASYDFGPCHLVSVEIAVAMSVPIENPPGYEVRGVISFL